MVYVVYIDFLKIFNSVIFWYVYMFLWLWKYFEVYFGNGNVIYVFNYFWFFDFKVFYRDVNKIN